MRMEDALADTGSGVEHQPVVVVPLSRCDGRSRRDQLGRGLRVGRCQRSRVGVVIAWHDENVRWRLGVEVAECDRSLRLVHDLARNLAGHDLAEQTVGRNLLVRVSHVMHSLSREHAATKLVKKSGDRGGKPPDGAGRATSVNTHAIESHGAVMERVTWGADEAIEQLYAAHWRRLVRLSVLLVRDVGTAEEIVQDAFVAVHGRWGKLRDPDLALAYLRQAVVNRSRSALRHRAVVWKHAAREGLPLHAPSADQPALAAARRTAVLEAMRELPQRQREVLALRYYLELSEAEISDALGISRGAVKSHASRGSATLRGLLANHLSDNPLDDTEETS